MSILERFSLKNRVAVVTGGRGVYGRQIVRAMAQGGARTYMASRSLEELEEMAKQYRNEGYDVRASYLDLGCERSIEELKNEIIEKEGKVDVLINNSVLRPVKTWQDDAKFFSESMKVNATGLFLITRAFGDVMAKDECGSIINIGSIQGMVGPDATLYEDLDFTGYIPDYFFHKGGMINFTRFVASYYGQYNVRCNCISPGGLRDESHSSTFIQRYSKRTFLGRMANNTDLMGVVVFLASDASLYITGTNIPVDGGYTAK